MSTKLSYWAHDLSMVCRKCGKTWKFKTHKEMERVGMAHVKQCEGKRKHVKQCQEARK